MAAASALPAVRPAPTAFSVVDIKVSSIAHTTGPIFFVAAACRSGPLAKTGTGSITVRITGPAALTTLTPSRFPGSCFIYLKSEAVYLLAV